ncbi:hypothetical protein [Limosilactobacillus reuteri]|nr:hypothetical protein [Limosilactobacillus reuteri]
MILIDFLKKNKWNIIAILIFFGLCIYYAYDKTLLWPAIPYWVQ